MVMRFIKYLIPVWVGVTIYAALAICFGPKGLSAYNQMESEKQKEIMNIDTLININRDLSNTKNIIFEDKNNLYAHAKELGFAAPGERFIRIVGLGSGEKQLSSPGHIVYPAAPEYISESVMQFLAFFFTVTMLIAVCVYDFLGHLREKNTETMTY